MSDFSTTSTCRQCGVRFAPDDGLQCDCGIDKEDEEEAEKVQNDLDNLSKK